MLDALWSILTFPFRLVGWVVAILGRAVGLVLGFLFMMVGIALWANTWMPVGVPLFIIGLLLTLRSLG
jgi:hypothetical protein